MSVSIIIPTLNEEENVIRIYKKVYDVFQVLKINWEIIFVDDKSSDKTQEIINSLPKEKVSLIISKKRKGLGNAISLGWYRANLDYVLFLDCDSHVLNSDLINLINSKKLDHMVIGSRYLKK